MAALAVLAGLALPAPAAAHQLLVGNTGQTASLTVGDDALDVALGFTTCGNPSGYHLAVIEVQVLDLTTSMTAKAATGLPDSITEVAILTTLAVPGSGGCINFMAPLDTRLASDTTYWVVIQRSSGEMRGTSSPAEDTGSAAGWSIADNRLVRAGGTMGPFSEVSGTDSGPISIRVIGHVNTAASAGDESHIRRATGARPVKPAGLSAALNGDRLPASSRAAASVDTTRSAPRGDRLGRSTDGGATAHTLARSTGVTP